MNTRSLYVVCKTLDAPTRVIGLPLDEFIPAAALAGVFFCLGKIILAMLLAVLSVIGLRLLKRGQGRSWLINLCYWNLPHFLMRGILPNTPASHTREWIA